jgi:hypothetical protein
MNEIIDRFPVQQLMERYKIKETSVYARLRAIGIRPIKEGRRSFLSPEQLERLDRLDSWLQAGGTNEGFLEHERRQAASSEEDVGAAPLQPPHEIQFDAATERAVAILAKLLGERGNAPRSEDQTLMKRLAHYNFLERAAEKGWELLEAEVEGLLGVEMSAIEEWGDEFEEAGFLFRRAETRRGECWRVGKPEKH